MPVEPGILDANVLAYAVNADAPQHAVSRALLEAATDPSITLYVTSQILCELYSIITNPRRVAVVCSPTEALSTISAMQANGIQRMYTFNSADFEVFLGTHSCDPISPEALFGQACAWASV